MTPQRPVKEHNERKAKIALAGTNDTGSMGKVRHLIRSAHIGFWGILGHIAKSGFASFTAKILINQKVLYWSTL
jgi:hypothetical protein